MQLKNNLYQYFEDNKTEQRTRRIILLIKIKDFLLSNNIQIQ